MKKFVVPTVVAPYLAAVILSSCAGNREAIREDNPERYEVTLLTNAEHAAFTTLTRDEIFSLAEHGASVFMSVNDLRIDSLLFTRVVFNVIDTRTLSGVPRELVERLDRSKTILPTFVVAQDRLYPVALTLETLLYCRLLKAASCGVRTSTSSAVACGTGKSGHSSSCSREKASSVKQESPRRNAGAAVS